ncbi:MAG: AI-2E family transporter [Lachnospiraceae bacterium]|nr:AI-2E family transporter [Lachnospiraceae bacterium]
MGDGTRGFDPKKVKQIKEIIIFTAIIMLIIMYSGKLGNLALFVIDITMPFIIGAAIAFIINMPMKAIEERLLKKWTGKWADKLKRPISMVAAIILVVGIIVVVIITVLPQLITTIKEIIVLIPDAFNKAYDWVLKTFQDNPKIMKYLKEIDPSSIDWSGMLSSVASFAKNQFGHVLAGAASIIGNIANGFLNGIISVIFGIYVLAQKEKLMSQCQRIAKAYLKESKYNFVVKTAKLLNTNFHNFLTGQCLEAAILGLMFVVVMTILRLPYPLLAGVLIGFTALIPIAGAFIGCFICAFLILIISPVKMLIFVATFLILQQIEGNFIYPRVVGSSVGLPSLWVLMAVSVGGSLMGVIGMLIFIPIFSTIYMLLREDVNKRNAIKNGNQLQLIDISDKEDEEAGEAVTEEEEEGSQED